ncbi:hypothetical protein Fsol_00368 [Candidatus Fokinia solitaria]|uniref:Uncharacterized protein n=1 Tax=Candidatus Fokinia solitaria TaxID=1802984 RepID=A0A2U8BS28_9RICK|nr:hypothetical protein [Candidatus Fokinia solitaria]AWD33166.1 hypothetical protein Fsol_00368 [Candidatus Fokinia solitaria]
MQGKNNSQLMEVLLKDEAAFRQLAEQNDDNLAGIAGKFVYQLDYEAYHSLFYRSLVHFISHNETLKHYRDMVLEAQKYGLPIETVERLKASHEEKKGEFIKRYNDQLNYIREKEVSNVLKENRTLLEIALKENNEDKDFLKALFTALSANNRPHVITLAPLRMNIRGGFYNLRNDSITLFQDDSRYRSHYTVSTLVHELMHRFAYCYNGAELVIKREKMVEDFLNQFPPSLHFVILKKMADDFAILTDKMISQHYVDKVEEQDNLKDRKEHFIGHIMGEVATRVYDLVRDRAQGIDQTGFPVTVEVRKFFQEVVKSEISAFEKYGITKDWQDQMKSFAARGAAMDASITAIITSSQYCTINEAALMQMLVDIDQYGSQIHKKDPKFTIMLELEHNAVKGILSIKKKEFQENINNYEQLINLSQGIRKLEKAVSKMICAKEVGNFRNLKEKIDKSIMTAFEKFSDEKNDFVALIDLLGGIKSFATISQDDSLKKTLNSYERKVTTKLQGNSNIPQFLGADIKAYIEKITQSLEKMNAKEDLEKAAKDLEDRYVKCSHRLATLLSCNSEMFTDIIMEVQDKSRNACYNLLGEIERKKNTFVVQQQQFNEEQQQSPRSQQQQTQQQQQIESVPEEVLYRVANSFSTIQQAATEGAITTAAGSQKVVQNDSNKSPGGRRQ